MNGIVPWITSEFPDLQNVEPLGSGGQKLVFSATHKEDGPVVLKLVHPSNQDQETTRRELLAVQQVASERVPSIHGSGLLKDPLGLEYVWIREQRIHGESLRERLTQGPLPVRDFHRLALEMLEALAKAEEVRIVHRDVKPENIMVDANGNYWLLDFGIARHLELSKLTATAAMFGKYTPGYAPPEQFLNVQANIDSRSDLFALGVTLYEAATGINPFHVGAASELDVLRNVQNMRLPSLDLPCKSASNTRDFVESLTQKRRDHRPHTAKEALEWIGEIIQEES